MSQQGVNFLLKWFQMVIIFIVSYNY